MDHIFNLGTSLAYWYDVSKIVIVLFMALMMTLSLRKLFLANKYTESHAAACDNNGVAESDFKKQRKRFYTWAGATVLSALFLFFAFGPGEKPPVTAVEEMGFYQGLQQVEETKSPEVIRKKAADAKPDVLRRQKDSVVADSLQRAAEAEADSIMAASRKRLGLE